MTSRAVFLRAWLLSGIWAFFGPASIPAGVQAAETGCVNTPSAQIKTHAVKAGETLSEILMNAGFRRLWCPTCAVAEAAKQNQLNDPNRLSVGQIVLLRESDRVLAGCEPSEVREAASVTEAATPEAAVVAEKSKTPPPAQKTELVAPTAEVSDAAKVPTQAIERRPFKSELFFGIPLHVVEIAGTDRVDRTAGRLLTGINPGAVLAWRLRTDSGWGAEISSRIENDAIQADVNSINIDGREQKIGSVEAHVNYGSQIRFGLDFRARDRLIYRAATGPGIRVQTLPTRNFGATVGASLFQFSSLSLFASARYEALLADANVNQGSSYSGRLILRQDFEHWALESEAGYESSRYQTTLLEVVGSDLWLTWGISWKL